MLRYACGGVQTKTKRGRLSLRDQFAQRWFIIIGLLFRVISSGGVNEVSQFGAVVCSGRGAGNNGGGAAV
jgi:hypothetical protein